METKFQIDFTEFAFLVEACIPPKPIARSMFWHKVIDEYYFQMTDDERRHLFEWLKKNNRFTEGLNNEEDCRIFHARFDPLNQYMVTTNYGGKEEQYEAFKYNDRYHVKKDTWIAPEYIVDVKPKKNVHDE